eukprot:gene5084-19902_t
MDAFAPQRREAAAEGGKTFWQQLARSGHIRLPYRSRYVVPFDVV